MSNKFFDLCAEEQERILRSSETGADAGIGAPEQSIEEICEARGFEVVFEYRGFTVAVDEDGDPVALWDNNGPCATWL